MVGFIALLAAYSGASYPSEPIPSQIEAGRAIAHASPGLSMSELFRSPAPRASSSRIWGRDKTAIGWWSNGYEQKPVEFVVWLSPALVSRWLGLLAAREYWPESELKRRWQDVSDTIGDRRAFVIQLSAFPTLPTYEIGDYVRTESNETRNVRFVYTSGDHVQEMDAELLASWESRERSDLDKFAWWQALPFGRSLTGEFEDPIADAPLPLGDYYRSWYLVWADGTDDTKFEVRVLSKRKERVAKFQTDHRSSAMQ